MRIVLGGKFESAIIRELDEINRPQRNRTTHPYYLGLNRKSERLFFERAATFIAIAEEILMPLADWSDTPEYGGPPGLLGSKLGLRTQVGSHNEWDEDHRSYASVILSRRVLSDDIYKYISTLDLSDLSKEDRSKVKGNSRNVAKDVAEHYLCRLFLQLRETREQGAILVLDERDILLLSEIRSYILGGGVQPAFEFPDLDAQVILGSKFAGGLFNFAPHDAASAAAIRDDAVVRRYADRIRSYVAEASTLERERLLLEAMRQSADTIARGHKVQTVFEVISWAVKPLHYMPGVDAFLSAAEDLKDVASKLIEKHADTREWYLLAARATQVNIEEYLQRKRNL